MESFNKGDLVIAANATDSVWRILKVRKIGGIASFKCIRVTHPRRGDVENFPDSELFNFEDELPVYRAIRMTTTILGLVLGFACGWQAWTNADHTNPFLLAFAFWALVPPTWLIAEHALIFPGLGNPRNRDEFRHGQRLAATFWAGVATLMLVLYAGAAIERKNVPIPAEKGSKFREPIREPTPKAAPAPPIPEPAKPKSSTWGETLGP